MAACSMTGYGSAEETLVGDVETVFSVEVKTLNSRFLEIAVALPNRLSAHEMSIRAIAQKYFARGKVNLSIRVTSENSDAFRSGFTSAYAQLSAVFTEKDLIPSEPSAKQQALFQLALTAANRETQFEGIRLITSEELQALERTVHAAAEAARTFRAREGEKLSEKILSFTQEIALHCGRAKQIIPTFKDHFEERLKQKLAKSLQGFAQDDPRLALEVVLMVERSDCQEEIDRLVIHSEEIERLLKSSSSKSLGKELDFLAQEMARESSTFATKAQATALREEARQLRVIVEQLREQVQNIE